MRFGSLGKKKEVTINVPDDEENSKNIEMGDKNKPNSKALKQKGGSGGNNNDDDADREDEDSNADPTTDKVLDAAIETRGDTIFSLKRTEANLRMAEESGGESMQTLRKNDEILRRTEAIVEGMDVKTFRTEVQTMGRRLTRDKCFIAMSVLAVAAIVVTIVLPLAKPHIGDIEIFNTTIADRVNEIR